MKMPLIEAVRCKHCREGVLLSGHSGMEEGGPAPVWWRSRVRAAPSRRDVSSAGTLISQAVGSLALEVAPAAGLCFERGFRMREGRVPLPARSSDGQPSRTGSSPELPPGSPRLQALGGTVAARVSEVGGELHGAVAKADDTRDVRNAAAAIPAAKPLLRRAASSEQHEPLISHPHARRRESGSLVEERPERPQGEGSGELLTRWHLYPSEPPGFIPGEV